MAKGGGTQNQNVTQTTSLPAYAQPYFQDLMSRAQANLTEPYQPYQDASGKPIQRIAGFTDQQKQVQSDVANMQTPGQFGAASNLAGAAGLGSLSAGQYDPSQFNVQQVSNPNLNYFQMQGPDSFTQAGTAQQYMSPFIQAALDPQRNEAIRGAQQGQLVQNLGAARQGAYGGSRQLLAGMERERNLGQNLADIQARGMQTAFEQAQGQFNTEQQGRQTAARANLDAALGVQSLGSGQNMQAQLANQQSGLEGQRLGEQSRQFGANLGLQGLAQANQSAQTMGNLGQMQGQMDISRLNMQASTAAQQQALDQEVMSQQYQDFLRQENDYTQKLQMYGGLLNSVPITPNTNTATSSPSPSLGAQIMGTGLGALGAYKTLSGG